jgi:hypothetical protein
MLPFDHRYGRPRFLYDPRSLFGGGAPQPKLTAPPVMPDPMSPDAMEAKRRAVAKAGEGGRQSTQLTTSAAAGGTLAGDYSGTKLGG